MMMGMRSPATVWSFASDRECKHSDAEQTTHFFTNILFPCNVPFATTAIFSGVLHSFTKSKHFCHLPSAWLNLRRYRGIHESYCLPSILQYISLSLQLFASIYLESSCPPSPPPLKQKPLHRVPRPPQTLAPCSWTQPPAPGLGTSGRAG